MTIPPRPTDDATTLVITPANTARYNIAAAG
jgi:hypothetical protein